ncbi:IS630 family transposase [Myxococcus sp. AM011]|uniref:IS630 family transposase n=1 Tax=Myxococcus sp. AM011 TaxID=2745200 RepID=UPI001594EAE9|nr:IS630 family transposase [Myxococcus sp. AM011]NVJ27172.1 IS630 family transposase [Myxococcus sp. AM011]
MAVAAVGRGASCNAAARALGCATSTSTVVGAVRRYREAGREALRDRRAANGRPKVDGRFRERLARVLAGTPEDWGWCRPTWTRELLCLELQRRGLPQVSVATMGRVLTSIGARRKAAKPIVQCPWPGWKRRRRLHVLKCLEAYAPAEEPVLHVDEVDIHLNPKVGLDWCLPGQRRVVVTPGNNQKRFLAGALNVRTGRLTWVEGRSKASALFIQLLWLLAGEYSRARRIHLVLDNAAVHTSQKTRRALEQLGGRIVLHFLPPYCPEGNRIERVWLDLHANVTRNHRCRTMSRLMIRVHAYLAARNAQRSASPCLRRADLRRTA